MSETETTTTEEAKAPEGAAENAQPDGDNGKDGEATGAEKTD